jgi:hypothetical protein
VRRHARAALLLLALSAPILAGCGSASSETTQPSLETRAQEFQEEHGEQAQELKEKLKQQLESSGEEPEELKEKLKQELESNEESSEERSGEQPNGGQSESESEAGEGEAQGEGSGHAESS